MSLVPSPFAPFCFTSIRSSLVKVRSAPSAGVAYPRIKPLVSGSNRGLPLFRRALYRLSEPAFHLPSGVSRRGRARTDGLLYVRQALYLLSYATNCFAYSAHSDRAHARVRVVPEAESVTPSTIHRLQRPPMQQNDCRSARRNVQWCVNPHALVLLHLTSDFCLLTSDPTTPAGLEPAVSA